MSQGDILKVLKKKKGKWLTIREISEIVKVNRSNTNSALNKLFKSGDVDRKMKPVYATTKKRMSYGSPYIFRWKE